MGFAVRNGKPGWIAIFLAAVASCSSAQQSLSQPANTQPTTSELFSRIGARHDWQESHLGQMTEIRTYKMENDKHKILAKQVVSMKYTAPATKIFTTILESGSGFIRHRVFQNLIKDERKRVQSKHRTNNLIIPENYTMEILGTDKVAGFDCFVAQVVPRRKETHLFEGKIWIERQDGAIVKITGRLAKSPSFWVKHVDFTRDYQPVENFWLPSRVEATSDVRFFGTRILTIDYANESVLNRDQPVK